MPLKFDCNLEQIASIATAIHFWESPEIKSETAEFFLDIPHEGRWRFQSIPQAMQIRWKSISEKVVHLAESIHLPGKIRSELKSLIHSVGQRILHWAQFVRICLNLNHKCLGKIYFTSVGTINETKFFNFLQENPSLCISDDEKDDTLTKNCKIYTLACIFIQEDFIKDHLEEMRDMIESYFVLELAGKCLNNAALIRVWISFFFSSDRKMKLGPDNQKMALDIYSDLILLDKCKTDGFLKAATYFALKSAEDEKFLVDFITGIGESFALFLEERYLEMIVFLLNKMSDENKIDVMKRQKYVIFLQWLNIWPYQELLLQMLNIIFDNVGAHRSFTIFLLFTLDTLHVPELPWSSSQLFLNKDKTHQRILRKVLQMIPKEIKKERITSWINCKVNLNAISKESAFSIIAIIFNNDELKHLKNELTIDFIDEFFLNLIEKSDFKFIHDFLYAANFSVEETKIFKNKYFYLLERFAKDGKLDLAENLLNWMCINTSQDKTRLKRHIDTLKIFQSYYNEKKFNISEINRLLNWQFDGDSESIKKIKSDIWSEELLSNVVCKIWADHCHSSTVIAKIKCSEFLEWFSDVEFEEIKAFEKEKLIKDEKFVQQFCDYLHFAEDLKTIDELFKFCSLTSEKIKEIKRKIRDNAVHWIQLFAIEKNNFRVANAVVNWISENENEKKEIIEKYLNSTKGIELFSKVLGVPSRIFLFDPVLIFLNEWVQPYGNFSKIKQIVGMYWEKSIYKFLLDELEKNGCISPIDIQCCMNFSKNYEFLDME